MNLSLSGQLPVEKDEFLFHFRPLPVISGQDNPPKLTLMLHKSIKRVYPAGDFLIWWTTVSAKHVNHK